MPLNIINLIQINKCNAGTKNINWNNVTICEANYKSWDECKDINPLSISFLFTMFMQMISIIHKEYKIFMRVCKKVIDIGILLLLLFLPPHIIITQLNFFWYTQRESWKKLNFWRVLLPYSHVFRIFPVNYHKYRLSDVMLSAKNIWIEMKARQTLKHQNRDLLSFHHHHHHKSTCTFKISSSKRNVTRWSKKTRESSHLLPKIIKKTSIVIKVLILSLFNTILLQVVNHFYYILQTTNKFNNVSFRGSHSNVRKNKRDDARGGTLRISLMNFWRFKFLEVFTPWMKPFKETINFNLIL